MDVIAYASLRHYFDHISPVIDALRSTGFGSLGGVEAPPGRPWGTPLRRNRHGALWLVASGADAMRLAPAPVIYLEHGAGQSYHGDERGRRSGSYAGGEGLEHVVLFLCPNQQAADRWLGRYPDAAAAVVGCPALDRWHDDARRSARAAASGNDASDGMPSLKRTAAPGHGPGGPIVAAAFHWPNSLCPEAGTAWTHYRAAMPALRDAVAAAGGELVGHGHPRAWRQYRREWARIGVRPVTLAEVYTEADLLVVDNSSVAFEAMSMGIPVVWCDAPWWRTSVEHGLRFWREADSGVRIQDPADLVDAVTLALTDPPEVRARRETTVARVYSACDGRASERAATAILALSHQGG